MGFSAAPHKRSVALIYKTYLEKGVVVKINKGGAPTNTEARKKIAELSAANEMMSLRQLARAAGISPTSAAKILKEQGKKFNQKLGRYV